MQLTEIQLDYLLAHLLRDEQVISVCLEPLSVEDFSHLASPHHAAIWGASRAYYIQHKKLISESVLMLELDKLLSDPMSLLRDYQEPLVNLVQLVYRLEGSQFDTPYVLQELVQPLLDEIHLRSQASLLQSAPDLGAVVHTIQDTYARTRVNVGSDASIFDVTADQNNEKSSPPIPSGMAVYDALSGGGLRKGNVAGILTLTGGGKTLLALQVAIATARQGMHAMVFEYEQVRGEMRDRIWSAATGLKIDRFEGRPFEQVDPEARELLTREADYLRNFFTLEDMTKPGRGSGGIQEVAQIVRQRCNEGKAPAVVVIDWLGAMVSQYLSLNGKDPAFEKLATFQLFCHQAKHDLAIPAGTQVILTHQLDTESGRKGIRFRPTVYHAADFKGLSHYMNCCIIFTKADPERRCKAYPDKVRGAYNEMTVQLDGAHGQIHPLEGAWTLMGMLDGSTRYFPTADINM